MKVSTVERYNEHGSTISLYWWVMIGTRSQSVAEWSSAVSQPFFVESDNTRLAWERVSVWL